MAIKTAEKTMSDGKVLKIVLLPALQGIQMSTQLSKVAIPVLATMQRDNADLSEIALSALNNLDELEIEKMILQLFNGSTIDDFPIKPDDYFSGNYGELVTFLSFAIEANFKSFFSTDALSVLNIA
ncbi:phage tail assembly chaperone [Erwinia sp.]|uniref:phage tail assembly chaperone n=1 Tax=Erwinia citreus TaxID=558 RepID=UPI003C73A33A